MPTIQSVTSAVIAARRVGDGYARFDSRQASAEPPGGGGALRKLRRVRSSDRIMKTSGRLVRTSSPKVTASPYSRAFWAHLLRRVIASARRRGSGIDGKLARSCGVERRHWTLRWRRWPEILVSCSGTLLLPSYLR